MSAKNFKKKEKKKRSIYVPFLYYSFKKILTSLYDIYAIVVYQGSHTDCLDYKNK